MMAYNNYCSIIDVYMAMMTYNNYCSISIADSLGKDFYKDLLNIRVLSPIGPSLPLAMNFIRTCLVLYFPPKIGSIWLGRSTRDD